MLDVALCSLWLRALLQQGRWDEGEELMKRMLSGEYPRPNQQTYNYLLQYQVRSHRWLSVFAVGYLLLSDFK